MDTDAMQDPLPGIACPYCGEAMHGVREAPAAGTEARAVFRCANAHTVAVEVIETYDEDPTAG